MVMIGLSKKESNNPLLFMEKKAKLFQDSIAVGIKEEDGWNKFTFAQLEAFSKKIANYLIDLQIDSKDKVSILSESKPEWSVALFASVLAGAVTVPLDIKLTVYELTNILTDCNPKVLFTSKALYNIALELKNNVGSIEHIILVDNENNTTIPSIYNVQAKNKHNLKDRSLLETALIIYTSGTTGFAKGVQTTFGNILSQLESLELRYDLNQDDSFLSILPMNHLFELTVGLLAILNSGSSIYYSSSLNPKDLLEIMKAKNITYMIVVPAFLKLLKSSILNEVNKSGNITKISFNSAFMLAKCLPFRSVRKLLFKKIHDKFGGKFKAYISGGAPLDTAIADFFDTMGINIYQGYGMTETSPVISVNSPGKNKLGSVGKPIDGVRVKVDKNGEICVKGPNIMKGYYNRPDLTTEIFDKEGWLRTGDIGRFDEDGYLYVTGRIKNLIVLSGGKKVHPEEVEIELERSNIFKEACVLGIKKKNNNEEVCAVIVPNEELIEKYSDDKQLEAIIKKEVNALVKLLAAYKRPTKIYIKKEELPKTSTRKVKRRELVGSILPLKYFSDY